MELNRLFDSIESVYQKADVKAAFGEPQTIGDRTVIPVARVGYVLGLGFGRGERPTEEGAEIAGAGSGAGGGGGGMAAPIAVVEITQQSAKVIPIVDSTVLGLAGILMAAWNVFWIARTFRALKERRP